MVDNIIFEQLNIGWNAEPNAPELQVKIKGTDVLIEFYLNTFAFEKFTQEDKVRINFYNCLQYRLGPPNDEGFYCFGQSRYKKHGVKWGEFYLVHNSNWQTDFPAPVKLGASKNNMKHYLFYFRDETFECIASLYNIEFPKQEKI